MLCREEQHHGADVQLLILFGDGVIIGVNTNLGSLHVVSQRRKVAL